MNFLTSFVSSDKIIYMSNTQQPEEEEKMAQYAITAINGDTWRPGMPEAGWIVRYGLSDYGWLQSHVCTTEAEANEFAASLDEVKNG